MDGKIQDRINKAKIAAYELIKDKACSLSEHCFYQEDFDEKLPNNTLGIRVKIERIYK